MLFAYAQYVSNMLSFFILGKVVIGIIVLQSSELMRSECGTRFLAINVAGVHWDEYLVKNRDTIIR